MGIAMKQKTLLISLIAMLAPSLPSQAQVLDIGAFKSRLFQQTSSSPPSETEATLLGSMGFDSAGNAADSTLVSSATSSAFFWPFCI